MIIDASTSLLNVKVFENTEITNMSGIFFFFFFGPKNIIYIWISPLNFAKRELKISGNRKR